MKWTIEEAITKIREIEPKLKSDYGYFLGLCGGVLRKGASDKDLDLICIPMNGDKPPDMAGALTYFKSMFGEYVTPGFQSGNTSKPRQLYQPLTFYCFRRMNIDIIFQ